MSQEIKKLLPKKEVLYPIQARVSKELYNKVNSLRKKNKWSWRDVVKASMMKFVEELEK